MTSTDPRLLIKTSPYWKHAPHPKQLLALTYTSQPSGDPRTLLYGGAGSGGKSEFIVFAATQYLAQGAHVLILRKTDKRHGMSGGIAARFREYYFHHNGVRFAGNSVYFPNDGLVEFGHVTHSGAHIDMAGLEYQVILIDESTQVQEDQIRFLYSRLRRKAGSDIPTRMILCTNPLGVSHNFHKHIVDNHRDMPDTVFIPAKVEDNPSVDIDDYNANLDELDPVTRQAIKNGDWNVDMRGGLFNTTKIKEPYTGEIEHMVRAWDFASAEHKPGTDPDWTVGALVGLADGKTIIMDIKRFRIHGHDIQDKVVETAHADGTDVEILMEQSISTARDADPLVAMYQRNLLRGYAVSGVKPMSSKPDRARPLSTAMSNGLVHMQDGEWNTALKDEFRAFPSQGIHDDQVDAVAHAHRFLTRPKSRFFVYAPPTE